MFSFKKQFKLEINQTRDKNTLPSNMAPWHLGHHQRQRATCTFSTNLLPRKQVTKLREKFHDLFLKQIGRLHLRDSCLSSKKRIRGPEISSIDPLLFTPKQKTTQVSLPLWVLFFKGFHATQSLSSLNFSAISLAMLSNFC